MIGLTHSPADVIRQLIVDLGWGTLRSSDGLWPVHASSEPDKPDNAITVYDTESRQQGRHHFTGEAQEFPGIQVRVRGINHTTGYTRARAIATALESRVRNRTVTVGGMEYRVQSMDRAGGILNLGDESPRSKRNLFTVNYRTTLERVAKLVWTENTTKDIVSSYLGGTNKTTLYTAGNPLFVFPDLVNGRIWYSDSSTTPGTINKFDFEGNNHETVVDDVSSPDGLVIDWVNEKLIYVQGATIRRCNLNGTNREDLITGLTNPLDLFILNNYLWGTDNNTGKVHRWDLDGSNETDLYANVTNVPEGIALSDDYIFFVRQRPATTDQVMRMDHDGGNLTTLASGLTFPVGLDWYQGYLYICDATDDKIIRLSEDGTHQSDLLTGLDGAFSVRAAA